MPPTKDELAAKAADEILALINAQPRTPTRAEIAALVGAALKPSIPPEVMIRMTPLDTVHLEKLLRTAGYFDRKR